MGRTLRKWIFMESNHIEKKEESPAHTAMAGLCSLGSRTAIIYAKNVFHCRRYTPNGYKFLHRITVADLLHFKLFYFPFYILLAAIHAFSQRQNIFAFLLSDYLTNDKALVCEEIHFRNVIYITFPPPPPPHTHTHFTFILLICSDNGCVWSSIL